MADWNAARSSPVLIEIDYLRCDWGEVGQVFRVEHQRSSRDKHSLEVVSGWASLSQKRCAQERLRSSSVRSGRWKIGSDFRRDATLGEDRCGVHFPPVAETAGRTQ